CGSVLLARVRAMREACLVPRSDPATLITRFRIRMRPARLLPQDEQPTAAGGCVTRFGSGKEAKVAMRDGSVFLAIGAVVALAVVGLAWYVMSSIGSSQPATAVAALAALAAVLTALPPIIKAIRGE